MHERNSNITILSVKLILIVYYLSLVAIRDGQAVHVIYA